MIPHFGKRGTKQFTCGKPIRFGFKLWCFDSNDGYLFHSEPYCGAAPKLSDTSLGQGEDVVLGIAEKVVCRVVSLLPLTTFYLFFLLDELSKRGIGGQLTIRQNRFENAAV